MTSAGMSVGGYEDIKIVIDENVMSDRIIAGMKMKRLMDKFRKNAVREIAEVMSNPKYSEACISPKRTVVMDTGEEINLSKVLLLDSHGIMVGPTAVDVKKVVIETRATKRIP